MSLEKIKNLTDKILGLTVGDLGLTSKELVAGIAEGALVATHLQKCTGRASKIWQSKRNYWFIANDLGVPNPSRKRDNLLFTRFT